MCCCDENCMGNCTIEGYNKCSLNCYEITDLNDNIIKTITHDLPPEWDEMNQKNRIKYCNCCLNFINMPTVYDTTINKFKTDDGEILEYYDNFIEDNIIYDFTSLPCEHCSDILKKAYFIVENNTIKIYDENNNLLKINDIETLVITFNSKLISDISKKILYCESCNFIIFNNLIKHIFDDATSLPCGHCSDILKKAYFIVENNTIKIYDENNNLLKINDIETSMEDFFSKLTSDISKKILYCECCNFLIFNNLIKHIF